MTKSKEFEKFDQAMGMILRANPKIVKATMQAEKRERAVEAARTGKRGRGRPPKNSLASSRASFGTD